MITKQSEYNIVHLKITLSFIISLPSSTLTAISFSSSLLWNVWFLGNNSHSLLTFSFVYYLIKCPHCNWYNWQKGLGLYPASFWQACNPAGEAEGHGCTREYPISIEHPASRGVYCKSQKACRVSVDLVYWIRRGHL